METRSYKVTSPIRFGGRICNIGETVRLTDAEAAQFTGCIELADPEEDDGTGDLLLELENRKQQLEQRYQEFLSLKGDYETLLQEKNSWAGDLEALQKELATRDKAIAARDKAIEGLKGQLARLKEKPAGKAPEPPPKTGIPA